MSRLGAIRPTHRDRTLWRATEWAHTFPWLGAVGNQPEQTQRRRHIEEPLIGATEPNNYGANVDDDGDEKEWPT